MSSTTLLNNLTSSHQLITVTAVAVGISIVGNYALHFFRWLIRGAVQRKTVIVKNYKPDMVYLFNFPICKTITTISPFALKVETYLRLKKIPFETIRSSSNWSKTGQIPFIEFNGQEIGESNMIIKFLEKQFCKSDDNLTVEQKGISRSIATMLDNQTVQSYFYYRYVEDTKKFVSTWTFVNKYARWFVSTQIGKGYKNRAIEHGIGRNPPAVIYELGCQDLQAASDILGTKEYLLGDEMTTVDCYLFAHLAQILYIPVDYPHKAYIKEHTPNLCDYAEKIKARIWPDWDKICSQA